MISKIFSRSALHEHADPAQRVQGVALLPPDSAELAQLLATDAASEVRLAAARRCANPQPLAAALATETDAVVRAAVATSLGHALAATTDAPAALALLAAPQCTDAIRSAVARHTQDAERRRAAIAGIRDENLLIDVALTAEHADARMDAAQGVHSPDGLRRLAGAAKNKDRGVARHARQRADALADQAGREAAADAALAELEALTAKPGPILTAVVELDRRWQALALHADAARQPRWDAARGALHARFEREHAEQRARREFDQRVRAWIGAPRPPATADTYAALRTELATLREEARGHDDATALALLDQAEQRISEWEQEQHAVADAEAVVLDAERLAAGTSIDHADLPERWRALDLAIRGPALTQRFEAALIVIEHRRLTQIEAAKVQSNELRQRVHALLHAAEQAFAGGQLQAARAGVDEIKAIKVDAGALPKPTVQRLSRLVQQLTELERWESFGQRQARVQLCERAEALAAQPRDAAQLAQEVRKLRTEWKALDAQHAGVPKALWERFDGGCERAYAQAARHFAEVAAQRKEARRQRDEFVAAAALHVPTLLAEPRDWRAIERWLRDTDRNWREGNLGSVDPGAWKKLDAKLKEALGPLRQALGAARDEAKAGRLALIAEANALVARATERDVPSLVKAIQARWQEQSKAMSVAQRDERALWDQLRTACDAVFNARHANRREEDDRRQGSHKAMDEICARLEPLSQRGDADEAELRRGLREVQDEWDRATRGESAPPAIEARFRRGRAAVEALLGARSRAREAVVWQTLAAKERLCEALDRLALAPQDAAAAAAEAAAVGERWNALPALATDRERKLTARRDAALHALADAGAAAAHAAKIEQAAGARADALLDLEMRLKLDSPPELQAQRLALQVRQLKQRFEGATGSSANTPAEILLHWCALPGVADARDRARCERIVAAIESAVAPAAPATVTPSFERKPFRPKAPARR